jgi:hypothetical protein
MTALLVIGIASLAADPVPSDKGDPAAVALKGKFGPRDVELKLQDGSMVRGELKDVENIVIKTAYGPLTVPISDMLRFERGDRVSERDAKELLEAVKDLDNDEFTKRTAAQYKLEGSSPSAIDVLKTARETASPEAKSRIDTILKKLTAKAQNKHMQSDDIVRTARFEAVGTITFETLKLKSRLGDLTVKLEDIQSLRWLNRGENKTVTLEPNAAMGEWIDTGIDTAPGDKVAIAVSGTINPFNNQEIGPQGSDNWGNNGSFLMGAVVGKLGSNGEMFLIGAGKSWGTESKERLYVKIHWNRSRTGRSNEASKGRFTVKIATGAWADELDMSHGGDGDGPRIPGTF